MEIDTLIKKLEDASIAYYESDKPIMSDAEYDKLTEALRTAAPNHSFFKKVGAVPKSGATELPYPMPSLRKLHPDTVSSWRVRGPFVASDKLDGVSALWVPSTRKLYLRGNGQLGQDVSFTVPYIQGLKNALVNGDNSTAIRGELIVPRAEISNARNWVNGALHTKQPVAADLRKIQFVAYQVVVPKRMRTQQFSWLAENGFHVVFWKLLENLADVESLKALFLERRANSPYECDGIVLGQECIYTVPTDTADPKDCAAFKMPIDDQRAETTVLAVEWASSKGGLWIPRIRFQPVQIGHATIEWASGHTANMIWSEKIGPGTRLIIRRSGDVIPTVDKILAPTEPQMPLDGRWEWDANHVHAKDTTVSITDEKLAQTLAHMCTVFGVEGYSETSLLKVVKSGVRTPKDLLEATKEKLQQSLGPTLGPRLLERFRTSIVQASPEQWIRAWTGWSRGFGVTRIKSMLAICPDVRGWSKLTVAPEGMSAASLKQVQSEVPEFLKWRSEFEAWAPTTIMTKTAVVTKTNPEVLRPVVFSGFRDATLQDELTKRGYTIQDSITKQTVALIVISLEGPETTKVKQARQKGIQILARESALKALL